MGYQGEVTAEGAVNGAGGGRVVGVKRAAEVGSIILIQGHDKSGTSPSGEVVQAFNWPESQRGEASNRLLIPEVGRPVGDHRVSNCGEPEDERVEGGGEGVDVVQQPFEGISLSLSGRASRL